MDKFFSNIFTDVQEQSQDEIIYDFYWIGYCLNALSI